MKNRPICGHNHQVPDCPGNKCFWAFRNIYNYNYFVVVQTHLFTSPPTPTPINRTTTTPAAWMKKMEETNSSVPSSPNPSGAPSDTRRPSEATDCPGSTSSEGAPPPLVPAPDLSRTSPSPYPSHTSGTSSPLGGIKDLLTLSTPRWAGSRGSSNSRLPNNNNNRSSTDNPPHSQHHNTSSSQILRRRRHLT